MVTRQNQLKLLNPRQRISTKALSAGTSISSQTMLQMSLDLLYFRELLTDRQLILLATCGCAPTFVGVSLAVETGEASPRQLLRTASRLEVVINVLNLARKKFYSMTLYLQYLVERSSFVLAAWQECWLLNSWLLEESWNCLQREQFLTGVFLATKMLVRSFSVCCLLQIRRSVLLMVNLIIQVNIKMEEIRQEAAEQAFLAHFMLNEKDYDQELGKPIPYVCIAHLNKYPGFFFESIYNHFIRYIGKVKANQLWLQYENQPMAWNLPFLVLLSERANEEVQIVVNVKRKPACIVPMAEMLSTELKNRYFWNLKQACMIRYKHKWEKQIFQTLRIDEQDRMLHLYQQGQYEEFYQQFDRIWDQNILKKENKLTIPMRVFVADTMIQRPFVLHEGDETIKDMLQETFGEALDYEKLRVFVQGVELDLDCAMRTLFFILYGPDGFSYIVLK